jgi:Ca2+/Na+ antiporter
MDISIGNLVGSNVFNIMSVLGAASLVRPILIPGGFFASGLWIDYLVMLFTSFLPWLMMRKDLTVSRRNGWFRVTRCGPFDCGFWILDCGFTQIVLVLVIEKCIFAEQYPIRGRERGRAKSLS